MSYGSRNVVKDGASVVVAASQTNSVVTGKGAKDAFYIHPAFMRGICIDIVCTAVTAGAGVTAKLQTRYTNAQSWVDSATVSITANGTFSIRLLDTVSADQTYLPLRNEGRVVITTGGSGATVSVDAVIIPQIA